MDGVWEVILCDALWLDAVSLILWQNGKNLFLLLPFKVANSQVY